MLKLNLLYINVTESLKKKRKETVKNFFEETMMTIFQFDGNYKTHKSKKLNKHQEKKHVKRAIPRHIIIKLPKTHDKTLKPMKQTKKICYVKRNRYKHNHNFS